MEQGVLCRSGPWWAVVSRSRADQIYYFNCKNGEKTWTKPQDFICECPSSIESVAEERLNKGGCKLKMKTSLSKKLQHNNLCAPYPKQKSEDTASKTDVNKQVKERKNLGSFEHTFKPPVKPTTNATPENQSTKHVVPVMPSSSSSRVSLNIKNKKPPKVKKAASSVFGEEKIESKFEDPSKNVQSTSVNQNRPDVASYSAKRGPVKQVDSSAESPLVLRNTENRSSGKPERLKDGEVIMKRLYTERQQLPLQLPPARRKSGGLGEERLRKLRNQLTAEIFKKPDNKTQPPERLTQDDPKEPAKRKGLLPTPPRSTRIDRNSNTEKSITIVPEERAAKRHLSATPPGVMKIDNSNSRKDILDVPIEVTGIVLPRELMKIDDNSNFTKDVSPDVGRHQENLSNTVVGDSLNFKLEVSVSNAVPAAEVIEIEAMDVDEEAQVLSDIKALRTAVTWDSFDTEWTPMEIENVGVSSDTPVHVIIVLDTNILLSNLSFVQDLRDSLKLNGDHPILYLPWMVLQELDRLKERNAKVAKAARAAVSFLNDSFKRKHPRVRGQTGREASRARKTHVEELCPDDSILESCLQLQEQDFHTLLLSNDVSLCNKALVHNIKAVTKIQFTNEISSRAETKRSLHTGLSPSPEKKISVMDRLHSLHQPTEPHPIEPQTTKFQPVQHQSKQIETPQTTPLEGLKKIILDTFSKVLSTEMEAEYGTIWTKRVLYKPPWELTNIFSCIAKHWFVLCDNTTPEAVKKAASELKKIFVKGANNDSIDEIIKLSMEICNRLPFKYDEIIAPLEQQIQAFTSGCVNKTPDQNCQNIEGRLDVNVEQRQLPPVANIVLAYFGSLWNILHSFCINLKLRLDNGISLDSGVRIHCKEMLNGTSELVSNIKGILSISENELDITHPGIQGIFDILRSATTPPGAEPLQIQNVYAFCVHPDTRGVLRNGLSQLEDCKTLLVTALKSGNNFGFN